MSSSLPPHPQCVFASFLQREKHKLNPNRNLQINVRKVRTRREEWERRKMGIEFMSDAKKLEQAGSTKEDRVARGFVVLLSWVPSPGFCPALAVRGGRATPTDSVSCSRNPGREHYLLLTPMALCGCGSPGFPRSLQGPAAVRAPASRSALRTNTRFLFLSKPRSTAHSEEAGRPFHIAPHSLFVFWLNRFLLFRKNTIHCVAFLISFSVLTVNVYPVHLPFYNF